MATTQEILKAAQELGKVIATHDVAKKFAVSMQKLSGDIEAQRLLNDLQRHLMKLQEKEQQGIEMGPDDKKTMEKLQGAVARNAILRDFQLAQMDYLDLMRQVDEAMSGEPQGEAPPVAKSPLVGGGGLKLQ
jgi:cell fate (sporulation/competence/biofilm development) regulator YlbF (YheA/YmcA/DUF963 family)